MLKQSEKAFSVNSFGNYFPSLWICPIGRKRLEPIDSLTAKLLKTFLKVAVGFSSNKSCDTEIRKGYYPSYAKENSVLRFDIYAVTQIASVPCS